MCAVDAEKLGLTQFDQSNYEGQLIEWIHELGPAFKSGESIGVVYNPGAHTHYNCTRSVMPLRLPWSR